MACVIDDDDDDCRSHDNFVSCENFVACTVRCDSLPHACDGWDWSWRRRKEISYDYCLIYISSRAHAWSTGSLTGMLIIWSNLFWPFAVSGCVSAEYEGVIQLSAPKWVDFCVLQTIARWMIYTQIHSRARKHCCCAGDKHVEYFLIFAGVSRV